MSQEPPPIIQTKDLRRTFGDFTAIDGLSLSIRHGEIFGLVGPDGAGKTTTLRLLCGLLDITSGAASVAGRDLRREREKIKPIVGYMAQQFSLYADLSVVENLEFFADMYHVVGKERANRIEAALRFARLTTFRTRRARHLSGGMQKKLALAATLLHRPKILLLDEPTTGVDPVSRREFWEILAELHLDGTSILVSTPYMDEAERCQRVGLMYKGRMMICDRPERVRHMVEGVLVEFRPSDWRRARKLVENLPGVLQVRIYGDQLRVFVDSPQDRVPEIVEVLAGWGVLVEGIRIARPQMEEAFISLIQDLEA